MAAEGRRPRVSVVVATRNRLPLLREAVASVAAQSLADWQLVVADDASADGTAAWLATLDDPRVEHVVLERHAERSAARNAGLERARAPYVMFLDDDDLLRPRALERLAAALDAEPAAVAAVGARWRFDGRGGVRITHPHAPLTRDVWRELLAGWSTVSGQNLFRTDDVRAVGGYRADQPRAEDRRLLLALAGRGPFRLVPEVVLDYRVHDGQQVLPYDSPHREAVFSDFVAAAPRGRRREARRLRRAGRAWRSADHARGRGRHLRALALYGAVAVSAPRLLRSPVTRPLLAWSVLDAIAGARRRGARPRRREPPPAS